MKHYSEQWIQDWCQENGWTDWFQERSIYWAFPPNAVMPTPIPAQVLRSLKARYGLCLEERIWCLVATGSAAMAVASAYLFSSPMPLVVAFGFCAIIVAQLDPDDE